jgi:pimeloyl-ACP methyl ester carboxylesterase
MTEHVLFIHSTGTSRALWANVPPEILGGRSALTPANLGYPPNPPIARGTSVTVDDEADHLLRALPAGGERVHLVAHSYGATIGLVLADRPALRERLASIFLAEPVLFGALIADEDGEIRQHDPEAVRTAYERFEQESTFLDPVRGGTEEWLAEFVDYWNRPGSWSKMPESLKEPMRAIGWKMFQEVLICRGAQRRFRDWRFDVPTTLVYGERTTIHSLAMTRALERTHSGSDIAVIEMKGTGHMAPLTHPEKVHAELGRHLRRIAGSPR